MGRTTRAESRRSGLPLPARLRGWPMGALLAAVVLVLILVAGSPVPSAGAASPATFGKTTIGAGSDAMAPDRKRANPYSLGQAGTVTKLTAYLEPTGTAG